ncbi:nucleotide-binding alpha-beta plait domain-containing protein [Tanacetum coccineum]
MNRIKVSLMGLTPPTIVLEDDCLNAKDLTLSLMGRVKQMASLVNLKKALCNEGFDVVKISYLGELWVLLKFDTAKAKDSFRGNVGVGSWFLVIKQAYAEFLPEGRLVWVELDGVPFKFWSGPTFKRIAAKWGELLDVDDYDESNFHSQRICILYKVCEHIHESFKIVFRGKVYWVRASEVLGWTPEFSEEEEEDELSVEDNYDGKINDLEANNGIDESDVEEVLETLFSKDPFGLYPLLNKENIELARKDYGENERDDNSFVNLNDGKDNSELLCKGVGAKLWVITWMGASRISLRSLNPKENLGLIDEFYVFERSRPRPKGQKRLVIPLVKLREGSWIDLMRVVIYAPQEAKEKRMLWDYLAHVSNQWVGKLAMMGDFNEMRYKSDRYGSNFNAHDAEIFNSFMYNAGLDEVPLGGSAYTWSNSRGEIYFLKEELWSCDEITDKGDCSNEVVHKRTKILNKIHQVNNIQASKITQKAKIKWAIEGDENVKFFHGMLNKKRNQSNIRGIMVNGTWVDDPVQVKHEFFEHFWGRFDKPSVNRAYIDTPFPVSLSIDQKEDMERSF